MRVGFIGLGSIGQRHLSNVRNLFPDSEVIAYRQIKNSSLIVDGKLHDYSSIRDHYNIKEYFEYDDFIQAEPRVAFVCNPSSLHYQTSLDLARSEIDIFIEKPVCEKLEQLQHLQKVADDNNIVAMAGFQTRFDPQYVKLKDIVNSYSTEELISARFEWGTFLPHHHKYEDYSKSYAACEELGGGVTLGLIHELDLVYDLLGEPENVQGVCGNYSKLTMSAEDTISVRMEYSTPKNFFVNVFLSYAQTLERHELILQFNRATIVCDFTSRMIRINDLDGDDESYNFETFTRNDIFLEEIEHFFSCVSSRSAPRSNLLTACGSMRMSDQIRELYREK